MRRVVERWDMRRMERAGSGGVVIALLRMVTVRHDHMADGDGSVRSARACDDGVGGRCGGAAPPW